MAIGTTYKAIDSDVASDDWQTSTVLPHLLRRNLNDSIEQTHVAGSHYYAQRDRDSGQSLEPPIVSTHPGEWWEIPILVPQCYGADTLSLQLYAEVQTASGGTAGSVEVRVALEGTAGASTTLTEAAGKHLTTEVTVACPQVTDPRGVWRGAIQFQSDELATLESSADLLRTIGRHSMVIESIATASAYATGRGDRLIRVTSLGTTSGGNAPGDIDSVQTDYYCGYVDLQYPVEGSAQANAARFVVWPEVDPRLQAHDSANNNTGGTKITDAVDIIELGAVQIFGYRWRLSGQRDYGLWANSTMRPTKPMAAMNLLSVDTAQRKLYETRQQVLAAGPDNGRGNTGYTLRDRYWHGARFGASNSPAYEEVASGTTAVRDDVISWICHVLYLGFPGDEDDPNQWRINGAFPSSSPSQEFESAGYSTPTAHETSDPGFMLGFTLGNNPEFWSSADLGREGDYLRYHYASFELQRNSNINDGDFGSVSVSSKSDVWVGAALVAENYVRP